MPEKLIKSRGYFIFLYEGIVFNIIDPFQDPFDMLAVAFKLLITSGYLQLILIVLIAKNSDTTSEIDNRG